LISFVPPSAGMFVWLQVHIGNHPDIAEMRARGEENPEQKLMEKLWKELAENKVRRAVIKITGPVYSSNGDPTGPRLPRRVLRRSER
jgi:hypothetical protein